MKKNRIKCPVCKKEYWKHTLKLHITNTGKAEVFKATDIMIRLAKNKSYYFSPIVFKNNCLHYKFKLKNLKNKKVFELNEK